MSPTITSLTSHFNRPNEEDQLHRINLQTLQNGDPHITKILDQAQRVCVYKFLADKREWERKDLEGTLFVYERSCEPYHGFVILSTSSRETFVQILKASLEFKHSPNHEAFLQYKVDVGDIYGIWFISKDDCPRVTECLKRLTVKAQESDQPSTSHFLPTLPQNAPNIFALLTNAQEKFQESKRKQEPNHTDISANIPAALQRLLSTRDTSTQPTNKDEREQELKKTLGIVGKSTLNVTELEKQLLQPTTTASETAKSTLVANKSSAQTSIHLISSSHGISHQNLFNEFDSHLHHNGRLMAPVEFQTTLSPVANDVNLASAFLVSPLQVDATPPYCHCQTEQSLSINPFSKDTLRQLLVDMLQNDEEFLAALHNAYKERQNDFHRISFEK